MLGVVFLLRGTRKPLGRKSPKNGEKLQNPLLLQEFSGDPNPQYFLKSTAVQMGGVLQYKWRRTAVQLGGVLLGFPFFKA